MNQLSDNPLIQYLSKEASAVPEKQWFDAARFFVGLKEKTAGKQRSGLKGESASRQTARLVAAMRKRPKRPKVLQTPTLPRIKRGEIEKTAFIGHAARLAEQTARRTAAAGRQARSGGQAAADILFRPRWFERVGEGIGRAGQYVGHKYLGARDITRALRSPFVGRQTRLKWLAQQRDLSYPARVAVQAAIDANAASAAALGGRSQRAIRKIVRGRTLSERLKRLDRSGLLPEGVTVGGLARGVAAKGVSKATGKVKGLLPSQAGMAADRKKRITEAALIGGGGALGGLTLGALLRRKKQAPVGGEAQIS